MNIFLIWFIGNNPNLMKSEIDSEFSHIINDLKEKNIGFESKTAFHAIYEHLKQTAPYLFPENPL
jgi:hypothetical protein